MPKRSTLPRSSSSTKPRRPIPPKDLSPKQKEKVYEIMETAEDRARALEALRTAIQATDKIHQWSHLLHLIAEDTQMLQPKPNRVGYVTMLEWPERLKVELDLNAHIVVLDRRFNTFARVDTAAEAMKEIRLVLGEKQ